jgi:hypothetical protein
VRGSDGSVHFGRRTEGKVVEAVWTTTVVAMELLSSRFDFDAFRSSVLKSFSRSGVLFANGSLPIVACSDWISRSGVTLGTAELHSAHLVDWITPCPRSSKHKCPLTMHTVGTQC